MQVDSQNYELDVRFDIKFIKISCGVGDLYNDICITITYDAESKA